LVPLLIHIGFHKTGTTWLQKYRFSERACGFTTQTGMPRSQIINDFVLLGPFDPVPAGSLSRYRAALKSANDAGLTLVLSHERLSGYPASGGFDQKTIADRLATTFPGAKILIVIREQAALIDSVYSQYITDGGALSLRRFLTPPPEPHFRRMPLFDLSRYEFDKIIAYYQRHFGRENVLVLPYELLDSSPQRFVDRISAFTGHPASPIVSSSSRANPRRTIAMQSFLAFLNRWFSRSELNPGGWMQVSQLGRRFERTRAVFDWVIPSALERRLQRKRRLMIQSLVGEGFAESNARTCDLIGLDLGQFGYACAPRLEPKPVVAAKAEPALT
jgi:hypothetical protein